MADVAPASNEMDAQDTSNPNEMDTGAENGDNNVTESAPEPEANEPEEVGSETLYIQNLNDRVKLSCKLYFPGRGLH